MKTNQRNRAFSLVELSIVILIIGVLVAAVGQGLDLLQDSKLAAARTITKSSRVSSLKDLALWFETTSEESFIASEAFDGGRITVWKGTNPQRDGGASASYISGLCGTQPTYVASAINGLPAIKFGDTSLAQGIAPATCLQLSNVSLFGSDGASVFFVAAAGSDGDAQTVLSTGGHTSHLYASSAGASTVTCGRSYNYGGTWSIATSGSKPIERGKPVICSSVYNYLTASSKINIQGWTNKTSADTLTSITSPTTSYILTNSSGGYIGGPGAFGGASTFTGHIAEIIIFNRALNTKERNSVEDYLSKKWNIKLN